MGIARSLVLAAALGGLAWFDLAQDHSAQELWQMAQDFRDPRPVRSILMLGNSRMSGNAMPVMLRHIADADGAREKWQVLMLAPNGSDFGSLVGNWRVEREVTQGFDDAIVQGPSNGQSTPENEASFQASGAELISALHPRHAPVRLIVNWAYDTSEYSPDFSRDQHDAMMQAAHASLARTTGARAVNVGKVWNFLHMAMPGMPLTLDGNHPTQGASYFIALCLYADLAQRPVSAVRWAPDGLSSADAATIRGVVDHYRSDL